MDKAKDFEKGFEEYKAKKKQEIEELGQDIYDNCPDLCENGCGGKPCYKCIAEALHRDNYRKIPENAVVLTREQMCEIVSNHNEINRQARKETAEKFERLANERIAKEQGERDGYDTYRIDNKAKYDGDIVSFVLFEICKEITGKGVQNGN